MGNRKNTERSHPNRSILIATILGIVCILLFYLALYSTSDVGNWYLVLYVIFIAWHIILFFKSYKQRTNLTYLILGSVILTVNVQILFVLLLLLLLSG